MKAIDILEQISNEVSNARYHLCKFYYGYSLAIEEAGYEYGKYVIEFCDGKTIRFKDSVFVTNERLDGKANIIMRNEEDCTDEIYIYKVR